MSSSTPSRAEMARLVAEAAERRQFQRPTRTSQANSSKVYEDHDRDLEERLKLRRMINKIVEADGIPSLRTLRKLAQNILDHPDEDKYKKLRLNNSRIRDEIMKPPNVLQFAIAMGFAAEEAVAIESYRIWLPTYHEILRVCAELLDEAIEQAPHTIARRDERLRLAKKREEDEESNIREKKRFVDDRRTVREREERRKQKRKEGQAEEEEVQQVYKRMAKVVTLRDLETNAAQTQTTSAAASNPGQA